MLVGKKYRSRIETSSPSGQAGGGRKVPLRGVIGCPKRRVRHKKTSKEDVTGEGSSLIDAVEAKQSCDLEEGVMAQPDKVEKNGNTHLRCCCLATATWGWTCNNKSTLRE
jgi:hypothetical protein